MTTCLRMLTKSDLTSIRKLVREEVGNESQAIRDELGAEVTNSRIRIQTDIRKLEDRVKNLEIGLTKTHKDLKKEIRTVVNFLDKDNLATLRRVKRIETHLDLQPPQEF